MNQQEPGYIDMDTYNQTNMSQASVKQQNQITIQQESLQMFNS